MRPASSLDARLISYCVVALCILVLVVNPHGGVRSYAENVKSYQLLPFEVGRQGAQMVPSNQNTPAGASVT